MTFRCDLGPQADKALDLLSATAGISKQAMVRELVIAAIADQPAIRELMLRDFRAELAASQASRAVPVEA